MAKSHLQNNNVDSFQPQFAGRHRTPEAIKNRIEKATPKGYILTRERAEDILTTELGFQKEGDHYQIHNGAVIARFVPGSPRAGQNQHSLRTEYLVLSGDKHGDEHKIRVIAQ